MSKYGAVLDCDGTITGKDSALVRVMDDTFLDKGRREIVEGYRRMYVAKAIAGKLTVEEEQKWLHDSVQLYIDAGLTLEDIHLIMESVKLRDGLVECLEYLHRREVPVAIISFGVRDFIKALLIQNGIYHLVDYVYALDLEKDKSGSIIGFLPGSTVLPSSKGICSMYFSDRHGIPKHNILAVGDSGGDKNLGFLKENRFGIAGNEDEKSTLSEFMGEVVVTESFHPAFEWLVKKIEGEK